MFVRPTWSPAAARRCRRRRNAGFQPPRKPRARCRGEAQIRVDPGDPHVLVTDADGDNLLVAELLGHHQGAAKTELARPGRAAQAEMLGPDPHAERVLARRRGVAEDRRRQREREAVAGHDEAIVLHGQAAVHEIHRGRADEARDEAVARPAVELERGADLLHQAVFHDDDAVTEGHGLDLVVSDEHGVVGTRSRNSLISGRICARSWASRFDSGSSNRNTWGLRTMQRPRATRCCCPPESCRGRRSSSGSIERILAAPAHCGIDLGFIHAAIAQAESQIVVHAHVLVERVVLEHHGDVAVFRLQAVHDPVADGDGAALMSSSPAIMRSVVDLPQPDGPTRTTNSWSAMCRLKSFTATTPPP